MYIKVCDEISGTKIEEKILYPISDCQLLKNTVSLI